MTKYVPKKLTQLSANESAAIDVINQNLDLIKEHIDDSVSRTGKSPSQMQTALDMNGQKILNLGTPTQDTDVVRLKDVVENKEEIKQLVSTASVAVAQALDAAETATSAASDMSDQVQLAKDWATKTDGPVDDGEYSSKYYAENIGADVHTVAEHVLNVDAVADDIANVNTVAGAIGSVNTVAANEANIDSVVDNITDIGTVATNISDINTCATNISAIQDAPTQAANAAESAEQAAQSAALSNPPPLLWHFWADHLLNDIRYLRADTFSWQDGGVYKAVYDHLVADLASVEARTFYGWISGNPLDQDSYYTLSATPQAGDIIYKGTVPTGTPPHYTHGEVYATVASYSSGTVTDTNGGTYLSNGTPQETQELIAPYVETINGHTIQYDLAADKHKIVQASNISPVEGLYNDTGSAWYYVLDLVNHKFKLPRENPAREELIQVVRAKGNGIAIGLTDGTNNFSLGTSNTIGNSPRTNTKYGQSVGTTSDSYTGSSDKTIGITTDSTKSGIISDMTDSTSVFKGHKYLYFYVGNYTQSAIEQTAGIVSETLNAKLDADRIQQVSTLPASPVVGTLYLIPE